MPLNLHKAGPDVKRSNGHVISEQDKPPDFVLEVAQAALGKPGLAAFFLSNSMPNGSRNTAAHRRFDSQALSAGRQSIRQDLR